MATQNPPKKNAAFTLYFTLYKNDGTVVANPGTITKKVSIDGADVADIAASVTEENTTYGQCSLVLAAGEMNGDAIWIYITDDTAGTVPFTATLYTSARTFDELATQLGIVAYGTAQSATGTTLVLAAASAYANDELNGAVVVITGGTGIGQSRVITDYDSGTDTATVDTWATTPSGTITYVILAAPPASATALPGVNVTQISGDATAADNLELACDGTGYNVGGGDVVAASVTGAVGSVASDGIAAASFASGSVAFKKNTALAKFAFVMRDSTNHAPAAGLTVTATRSIDGAAFDGGTLSAVTEVASGVYYVDFGAGDLNGNVIVLKCTAAASDTTFVTIVTNP